MSTSNAEAVTIEKIPLFTSLSQSPESDTRLIDMRLACDPQTGLLRQLPNAEIIKVIQAAYLSGSLLGTAIDSTPAGDRYGKEFLGFISSQVDLRPCTVLEVGCGTGWLASLMASMSKSVLGIEPGNQHIETWNRYRINVRHGFFPQTLEEKEMFDVVYSCSVAEHFPDLQLHLSQCRQHLLPGGNLVLSVPDCETYLRLGDPSILLHEHFSYFTEKSLRASLELAGFSVQAIKRSNFGSVLFAHARMLDRVGNFECKLDRCDAGRNFLRLVNSVRAEFAYIASKVVASGRTLGIYCPARGLNAIPANLPLRLFDDDETIQGKFLPIWQSPIESFEELVRRPVDELWILSAAFGEVISDRVKLRLPNLKVRLLNDLFPSK